MASTSPDPRLRPTLLVVEDEALIRLMLAGALEDDGYEVLEAEDASEAVRILSGNPGVRLVVSDVRMPGEMDGLGLAKWIRRNRPGTKVVISSGYVPASEQEQLKDAYDAFIGKPYRVWDLVERIGQLLSS